MKLFIRFWRGRTTAVEEICHFTYL